MLVWVPSRGLNWRFLCILLRGPTSEVLRSILWIVRFGSHTSPGTRAAALLATSVGWVILPITLIDCSMDALAFGLCVLSCVFPQRFNFPYFENFRNDIKVIVKELLFSWKNAFPISLGFVLFFVFKSWVCGCAWNCWTCQELKFPTT